MTREILGSRRQVMSTVVQAYPGGRECAAARLGLQVKRLDNQVYEQNGVQPLSDAQLHLLEQEAGTTHLPDYICGLYGGVFVPMPADPEPDNIDLYARALAADVAEGKVCTIIAKALEDGSLDEAELAEIVAAHRKHIAARHAEVGAVITLHRKTP